MTPIRFQIEILLIQILSLEIIENNENTFFQVQRTSQVYTIMIELHNFQYVGSSLCLNTDSPDLLSQ